MTDKEDMLSFIRTFSFAPIVSVAANKPIATHLPFVIQSDKGGYKLVSHFSKANDQWQNIEGQECLIIFSEPHAYISPTHYTNPQSVPTWNYVSVHVYGKIKLLQDVESAMNILEQMIQNYEPEYQSKWKDLSSDYKSKMLKGIVAFEVEITDIQATEKLSQNKTKEEREKIIATLEKS